MACSPSPHVVTYGAGAERIAIGIGCMETMPCQHEVFLGDQPEPRAMFWTSIEELFQSRGWPLPQHPDPNLRE